MCVRAVHVDNRQRLHEVNSFLEMKPVVLGFVACGH